jgi:hypothetical protein
VGWCQGVPKSEWPASDEAVEPAAKALEARPAWPQRTMSLEAQMPWRDTIRLMLLALLMAALATAALKTLVDQLS